MHLLAFGLDQRAAADDDVAAIFVDLEHDALDRAADVIADVGRTTNVDLAGGQEDVDASMSTSKPPLILRVTTPVTTSPSLSDFITSDPALDLLGLALAERDQAGFFHRRAGFSSTSSMSTLTSWPGFGRFFVFAPLVERNRPSLL